MIIGNKDVNYVLYNVVGLLIDISGTEVDYFLSLI